MTLSRVHPSPVDSVEWDAPGSRDRLLEWYRPDSADWVRLNLVGSVNGAATGPDGTSESLTNTWDRRVLGVIRELSDVVVIGAASVRTEGYQVPRRSRLAIVTRTGDLAGHRLDPERASRVIIVCPQDAAARSADSVPGAVVLVAPDTDGVIDPGDVASSLRAIGNRSIVCEGGPSLAAAFLEAGLIDDVCLTVSPVLRDATLPLLGGAAIGDHALTLRHVLTDDESYLFTRWATSTNRATPG